MPVKKEKVGKAGEMKQHSLWDFRERLNFSEGVKINDAILQHIVSIIPSAFRVEKSIISDDKNGTDYWILRKNLRPLSIDMKNREFCPIERFGSDDACIETTSVYTGENNGIWENNKRIKIGWTLDETKETDYIIYTWPSGKMRRYWILPFSFLCTAGKRHWKEWTNFYKEKSAVNNGYLTLNVYVPRNVIAQAMRKIMYGEINITCCPEVAFWDGHP